jgi:hypothetical protein
VLQNRVLRIFGPEREVTGGWRKLIHNFHSQPTIIIVIKSIVNKRKAYRVLAGELEEKRPLGRPRRRWVDKIKTDLVEVVWGALD